MLHELEFDACDGGNFKFNVVQRGLQEPGVLRSTHACRF